MSINKKACKVGMIIGCAIIIIGIILVTKAVFSSSSAYMYDSGYAAFGGDFYTYVNNNAAKAAYNVAEVGYAVESVYKAIGVALICFGLFDVCLFWAFNGEKVSEKATEVEEKTPQDSVPEVVAAAENKVEDVKTVETEETAQ